jgi:hypothetical protein
LLTARREGNIPDIGAAAGVQHIHNMPVIGALIRTKDDRLIWI